MSSFHLTFPTRGRAPVAPGEPHRRALVRTILRVAGERVVLFCVVDDHIHVVVLCDVTAVRTLARDLWFALRALAAAPLEPAHVQPVASRGHAEWLVGYVLTQTDHHLLDAPPALWSGSCFAEFAKVRAIDGWTWNIREFLPRFRRRDAFAAVGLTRPIVPASDPEVRALGAWRLASAAAFAAGADPTLAGNEAHVVSARCVAVRIAAGVGIAPRDIADALDVGRHAVARLGRRDAPPGLERAVRLRLSLEEAVRQAGARPPGKLVGT